jgi:predicted nucleic acid-binding protein
LTAVPRRTLVVDASVVLKWQLEDEDDMEQALALRDDFLLAGAVSLAAPVLLIYEITNAIHSAARRMRLTPRAATNALDNLLACEIPLHPPAPERTLKLAQQFNVSPYDAAYLEVAERLGAELWTADRPLHRAAAALPHVHWLGDYERVPLEEPRR